MSTQSPLPQNDPVLIAFQKLKKTPEYQNAVKWTIKAELESQADGELWFAFAAGYEIATRKIKLEIAEEIESHSYLAERSKLDPDAPIKDAQDDSQLRNTQTALRNLYKAVQKSRSVNDPLGMATAMEEAGKWF